MNQTTDGTIAGFAYVLGSVLFTVYGQLVVKWQVVKAGALPTTISEKTSFLLHLVLNPWIMSAMAAGFFALLCWLAAMTKFDLSYAYPFMSLAFVLVLIFSAFLFNEPVTVAKVLGVVLVIAGLIVASQG